MIEIMDNSINLAAGVFGRCETCVKNLQKSICALNCSPRQNDFLVATNETIEIEGDRNGMHTHAHYN